MSAGVVIDAQLVIPALRLLGLLTEEGASPAMVAGLLVGLPALLLTLIVSGYVTACLLAVIEDTANGCDRVREWPESDWRDWLWTLRFPLVSGFGALLAGAVVEQLAGEWNWAAALAALVVFPILLLSVLETGSALAPLSGPILKSCRRWWWAWLLFYAETGLMFLVWFWIARFAVSHFPSIAIWIAAPLSIAALLIYARLLGRLAWYTGWEEAEEEDEEGHAAGTDAQEAEPS